MFKNGLLALVTLFLIGSYSWGASESKPGYAVTCSSSIEKGENEELSFDNSGVNIWNPENDPNSASVYLTEHARVAGLDAWKDLEVLDSEIRALTEMANDEALIRDVGLGTGRSLEYLSREYPHTYIEALDINRAAVEFARIRFLKQSSRINILEKNVLRDPLERKATVTLLMWSLMSEFDPASQKNLLQKLYRESQENALVVVEMPSGFVPGTQKKQERWGFNQVEGINGEILKLYISHPEEIVSWGRDVGFDRVEQKSYRTSTSYDRDIYLFYKD